MASTLATLKAAGTRVDGLALGRDGSVGFVATAAGAWTEAEKQKVHAALNIATAPPTAAQVQARRGAAIQAWLDRTAQQAGYDNIAAAIGYAGSSVELWRRQATAFAAWRDAVWQAAIPLLGDTTQGAASDDGLIARLPLPDIPAS